MTTTLADKQPQTHPLFVGILHSEWIKIRSVRSTVWTLVAMVGVTIGLSALATFAIASSWHHMPLVERMSFDPANLSLSGMSLGQLSIGVLGIIIFTSEFATGTIRSTFAAVPSRPRVLAAKAIVFGAIVLVISEAVAFVSFFLGQAILSGKTPTTTLGHPGVLRIVIGSGLYLTILGLVALGIGVIIRHTAGAIATFVGLVMVLPLLVLLLPHSITNDINRFLPSTIVSVVARIVPPPRTFSPWIGLLVFFGYAVALLVIGGWTLVKRDA
ncbi:ABC transporter permease [Ferrimicrobium sp.]|uniref:ABC transporter permease n=1 Tax=Ferrimicrobium sp. TaxID=2926050 RepID=UPI0026170D02|nr:ABC transporter permease [Ferrimicrobium sp.]